MEMLVYGALTRGLLWAAACVMYPQETPDVLNGDIQGPVFWLSLLLALIVGLAASFFKSASIRLALKENPDSILRKMTPKRRKILTGTAAAVLVLLTGLIVFRGQIRSWSDAGYREREKAAAIALCAKVKDEVKAQIEAGTLPEDLDDLVIDGVDITRVEDDQRWTKGSGVDQREAVYMVDAEGVLVYFSFRDERYAATWSGPTSDQAFIDAHGGWLGGMGAGWSGPLIDK